MSCAMSITAVVLSSHSRKRVMRRIEMINRERLATMYGTCTKGASSTPRSAITGKTMAAVSGLPMRV
ncbi:hypothetical protein ABL78_8310 [Leptomonas seymouri]|uniref:Uncharacterized protein n=1 Tax=Leptomonas seymouri TaxID=5684 RepID=A0A0N0P291_LEPSE|nr:hypothetical protein ABL78_8310 [Leptomonas seymouri]|eukprot:KPI82679.1 hypothetical protein ABL78_8310 [Leptomonas seymouri]